MQRGKMDVSFLEGSVVETSGPEATLAQRVEKSTVERQGRNRFSPGWGSVLESLFGLKLVPAEIAREVGTSIRLMIASMVVEQARVVRAVVLDPAEVLVGLLGTRVTSLFSRIDVVASIATGAGTQTNASPTILR